MSGNIVKNPGRERLNQLLKAARARSGPGEAPLEATEYNWHEPHRFSRMQLRKLNDFVKRLTMVLADKFSGFCRGEFDVIDASTSQHFAGEFIRPAAEGTSGDFYLPFGADSEHPCGLLGLPEETAVTWARQLLGDAESDKGAGKTLSQLEATLLLDLTCALVEEFSLACEGVQFRPGGSMVKGLWPLEPTGIEELCRISFSVRSPQDNVRKTGSAEASAAYFLMTCEALAPVVGPGAQTSGQFSANEVSKAILDRLQTMPVTATAQLASTALTFAEIMNLRVGDILLLDRKVDEPAELIIEGRTVYCGWPVKSAGKYALTIAPAGVEETT